MLKFLIRNPDVRLNPDHLVTLVSDLQALCRAKMNVSPEKRKLTFAKSYCTIQGENEEPELNILGKYVDGAATKFKKRKFFHL